MKKEYFTKEGLEELKRELKHLKTDKTREIAELIKHAASYGDLKENFAYHDAKDKQAFLHGRILELEEKIRNAVVVETGKSDNIRVGSVIKVLIDKEEGIIQIVGSDQVDPLNGKISYESPLGKALLGKKKGDLVKIKTEAGAMEYKIIGLE